MKIDAQAFQRFVDQAQDEFRVMASTLREKGSQRFQRTLACALVMILGAYVGVYLPPVKRTRLLQEEIDRAKTLAKHADAYKAAREQLRAAYLVMPPIGSKEQWLQEKVIEAMRAENIVSDSILPPDVKPTFGLEYHRIGFSAQMRFPQLVGWLNRVETSTTVIHVDQLQLDKIAGPNTEIGVNSVRLNATTVVPSKEIGR